LRPVILRVAIAALGLVTLAAYLDRVSWFFELATFFRVQYALLLLLLGGVALAVRDWRAAVPAAVLAALNVATIAPHFTPVHRGNPVGTDRVTMLFVNVDVSNRDYARMVRYVREVDPDLVGITELSPPWAAAFGKALAAYRYRVLHVEDDAYGVGVYSRRPFTGGVERFPSDGPATIVGRIELEQRHVTVVLTHPHTPFGPHAGSLHQQQLRALGRARSGWSPRAVLCGDLNTPAWSGPLRALMREAKLSDSHRGYGFESTWPTWAWPLRTPIDNCLVSKGLAVTRRSRGPSLGSDHFPLVIQLAATRL
jgi:endonuclease/exonuclease/phosphatase (EEP) superfamily protein YafD